MTDINEPKQNLGFTIVTTAIVWAGVAVFGFYSATHMVAAGDTWVALACGRHHANHGVNPVEPFSFNSHRAGPTDQQLTDKGWPQWTHGIIKKIHPTGWINQNWLTHVVFYELVHLFGTDDNPNYNMLVVWKFALFIGTAFVVYAYARVIGVCQLLSAVSACLAVVVGRTFFDIRPACWSNFFVPLFLLILALAVYRNIRYIWLLVLVVPLWANFHGGYIYVYMMMVPFVGLHLISMLSQNVLVKIPFRNLWTICQAAIVSFVAMIIFNPYHLTNLTHTFEISISEHAESWRSVNEWRWAFDFLEKTRTSPNPVGEEEAFGVMCILLIIALAIWIVSQLSRPPMEYTKRTRPEDIEKAYQGWPKIDLPMLVLALFTTYMAVKSRRFIAIAGPAASPVVFLLIQQVWQVSVFKKTLGQLPVEAMSSSFNLRELLFSVLVGAIGGLVGGVAGYAYYDMKGIWLGIAVGILALTGAHQLSKRILPDRRYQIIPLTFVFGLVCLACGVKWGGEFKKVYLDPWPEDSQYHSVFMRMTASNVKPIDVCKFINANGMTGRMFNYWTEGGAISFGQKPDPQTGEIPVQLFMDGRAQAAYNHDKFLLWQYIYYGGEVAQRIHKSRKKITADDYREIADWIDSQLDGHKVWVILLPTSETRKDFFRTMQYSVRWRVAYNDIYQTMMVNIETPQGKLLIDNILNDKAIFPSEVSKNMTLTKLLRQRYSTSGDDRLEQAVIGAFVGRPCAITLYELLNTGSILKKPGVIVEQVQRYLADFQANQETYRRQNGYGERLRCAIMITDFIGRNFPDQKEQMDMKNKQYEAEEKTLSKYALW